MQEAREIAGNDPCDGWPWAWPLTGYRWQADRAQPICLEGFDPREASPKLATFLPYVRTDYHHYSYGVDWTLESGPDDAPACLDIYVPYSYSGGCSDYFAFGCWNPGDPPEVELGQPWFVNDEGQHCEVSLLPGEYDRIELYVHENPPEVDFHDDY
jgi:hypothetical protein